jgi:hypothetical protein
MKLFFPFFIFILSLNLHAQMEGPIFKFKNQWEFGTGSQLFISKTIGNEISKIYSPFSYASLLIKGSYMRKFQFGKMDYGYKKLHFVLCGISLKTHWMPSINQKIQYTGFNKVDSTFRDTIFLSRNRNGRASLSFFFDYTRDFKRDVRYRFGLGFEHHILRLVNNTQTINNVEIKKSTSLQVFAPSLLSFTFSMVVENGNGLAFQFFQLLGWDAHAWLWSRIPNYNRFRSSTNI